MYNKGRQREADGATAALGNAGFLSCYCKNQTESVEEAWCQQYKVCWRWCAQVSLTQTCCCFVWIPQHYFVTISTPCQVYTWPLNLGAPAVSRCLFRSVSDFNSLQKPGMSSELNLTKQNFKTEAAACMNNVTIIYNIFPKFSTIKMYSALVHYTRLNS